MYKFVRKLKLSTRCGYAVRQTSNELSLKPLNQLSFSKNCTDNVIPQPLQEAIIAEVNKSAHMSNSWLRKYMPESYFDEVSPKSQLSHMEILSSTLHSNVGEWAIKSEVSSDSKKEISILSKSKESFQRRLHNIMNFSTLGLKKTNMLSSIQFYQTGEQGISIVVLEFIMPNVCRLLSLLEATEPIIKATKESNEYMIKYTSCDLAPEKAIESFINYLSFSGFTVNKVCVACLCSNKEDDTLSTDSVDMHRHIADSRKSTQTAYDIQLFLSHPTKSLSLSDLESTQNDLHKIHRLSEEVVAFWGQQPAASLTLENSEIIVALCNMSLEILKAKHPFACKTQQNVYNLILNNNDHIVMAIEIANLIRSKQICSARTFQRKQSQLRLLLNSSKWKDRSSIGSPTAPYTLSVLNCMLDAVNSISATNIRSPNRSALGFSVSALLFADPTVISRLSFRNVYYVQGKAFNAFHVHFTEHAVGRLSIDTPRTINKYIKDMSTLYTRAFGIANETNDNKIDMPSGAAHCIAVRHPNYQGTTNTNAITENVIQTLAELRSQICYELHPNIRHTSIAIAQNSIRLLPNLNDLSKHEAKRKSIVALVDKSLRRIVHKNPNQEEFTVKIIGFPISSLSDSLLNMLIDKYGVNCKIICIADPDTVLSSDEIGLSHSELRRLVNEKLPLHFYAKDGMVSPNNVSIELPPSDTKLADYFELVSKHYADVFIICAWESNTLRSSNTLSMYTADMKPFSVLIVEGSRMDLSDQVEMKLHENGMYVFDYSLVNKGSYLVIDYEMLISELLSELEIASHREELVLQTMEKVQRAVEMEADLLINLREMYNLPLKQLQTQLSRMVTELKYILLREIRLHEPCGQTFAAAMRAVKQEAIPRTVIRLANDRIDALPLETKQNLIATVLSSRYIYYTGLLPMSLGDNHVIDKGVVKAVFKYFKSKYED